MTTLDSRTIIVTGGATGIGQAISRHLASLGAHVIIADKSNADKTSQAMRAQGLCVTGFQADITNEAQVQALVSFAAQQPGQLHALVNNAAIYSSLTPTPFDQLTQDEWTQVLNVNVTGVFTCCKAVTPVFRALGGGRIVNVSSAVAFKGNPLMAHYVASKGAVIALTRALASELGGDHILVNSVAPGFTLTERVLENQILMAGVKEPSLRTRLLKRDMTPEDLAGAVGFFCGSESAFITGQTLVVDGGAYFH